MPQFAVYRNPGRNTAIRFVVQVQTTRLDRSATRVILPLVDRLKAVAPDHPLTPHIVVLGHEVFADPLNIATVPLARLGDVLTILPEADQDRIIRAIDEMISRA